MMLFFTYVYCIALIYTDIYIYIYIYIYINYIYTISLSFNNACSLHIVVTTNEIAEYDKCSGMTNCS